jgi:hypothetical protein
MADERQPKQDLQRKEVAPELRNLVDCLECSSKIGICLTVYSTNWKVKKEVFFSGYVSTAEFMGTEIRRERKMWS